MPSELVLEKIERARMIAAPINKDWIESGDPQARLAILAVSEDCAASTFLWECTAGSFTWRYAVDETIYFLDGEALISVGDAPAQRYGAGDSLHISRGAVARWEVATRIRKVAFCRSVMPRPFIRARRWARTAYHRLRGRGDALARVASLG